MTRNGIDLLSLFIPSKKKERERERERHVERFCVRPSGPSIVTRARKDIPQDPLRRKNTGFYEKKDMTLSARMHVSTDLQHFSSCKERLQHEREFRLPIAVPDTGVKHFTYHSSIHPCTSLVSLRLLSANQKLRFKLNRPTLISN